MLMIVSAYKRNCPCHPKKWIRTEMNTFKTRSPLIQPALNADCEDDSDTRQRGTAMNKQISQWHGHCEITSYGKETSQYDWHHARNEQHNPTPPSLHLAAQTWLLAMTQYWLSRSAGAHSLIDYSTWNHRGLWSRLHNKDPCICSREASMYTTD